MSDPYKVLGISRGASDDDIKAAYRDLARKYHPDAYAGNPLSDLAGEKMKEINEAYDQVITQRRDGPVAGESYASSGSSQFWDIRRMINAGRITEAEELLDGVQRHARDAEWHFLKGSVQYARGWMEDAFDSFSCACEMNPNNREYRAALNQLGWQRSNGAPQNVYRTGGRESTGCSVCDMCGALICADCLCGCCGGNSCCC